MRHSMHPLFDAAITEGEVDERRLLIALQGLKSYVLSSGVPAGVRYLV
jgi:hypothetical protein